MREELGMAGPIPQFAPEDVYPTIPELGGARANYPIVTKLPQYGLCHEQVVGNVTTVALQQNIDAPEGYSTFSQGVDEDIWSIQLTARPGYYVAPEVQEQLGWLDALAEEEGFGEVGPNG